MSGSAPGFDGPFIVDQNLLVSPYGRHGSAAMGCGWVAAYNALRILGVQADPETVRGEMEKLLLLGGINGTPFFTILVYFWRKGFRIKLSADRKRFGRLARKAPAGIVFYLYHREGRAFPMGHFAAYAPTPDGRCRFYNDIPGKTGDLRTMWQFRKDRPAYLMLLITLNR